jgi:DNA-binding GntR family transcriptional regulator
MERLPRPKGLDTGPRTLTEIVAERLREMIIAGELKPGARLRQADIAEWFDVSITPVREAFSALAREGFVRQDAHRGVEVFRPTEDDIRENYEIRLLLEPAATEHAALTIDEATLDELDRILDEMEQPVEFALGTELNAKFHFTIYRAADRPQLLYIIERLRRASDVYVRVLLAQAIETDYRDAIHREHRDVLAGLRAHDPTAAREAMARHLAHSIDQITAMIAARVPGAEDPAQDPADTTGETR